MGWSRRSACPARGRPQEGQLQLEQGVSRSLRGAGWMSVPRGWLGQPHTHHGTVTCLVTGFPVK